MGFVKQKQKGIEKEKTIAQKQQYLLKTVLLEVAVVDIVGLYFLLNYCAYSAAHPRYAFNDTLNGTLLVMLKNPFYFLPINYSVNSALGIIILIDLFIFLYYTYAKIRVHNNVNTLKGRTEWADNQEITKKYAEFDGKDFKNAYNNCILSENIYESLDAKKHFHALNTLLIGTTGSGKTRYILKPNMLQMNANYVVTDPKGGTVTEIGESLRRHGYVIKILDIGYTLGGADTIRKAMSKKHEEEIEAERDNFIYGNEERHIDGAIKAFGMTAEEATELFDVMKKFGRYAFNKSHATAYAMVSLFTAFLKEYHPAEFYKYTLRHLPTDKRNKQMASYIKEMKLFGIEMEAPSLEIGNMEFELSADKKHLYFGLSDIKGMQEFTIKNKTTCLQDFVANNLNITQSILITLAKIGAFDTQWNGDTKKVSCEEALKWIEINKERYDKLAALKDKINTIITSYSNFLEDKEKNKMINNYNKYKTEYKIILQEIKDYYDETKKNPSKENSLIKYENQKKLCYYPISCKENLPFLQRENTVDFSVLNSDDGRTSHTIDVIIVDISEPLKTKTSNKTYYNVGLMDKTGNVITRRFEQPPTTLTARVNIPNERFFNCSIVKKIAKKNNTKELSAKELVEKVIDNELPLNNINENYVRINGNSKTVFTITEDKEIER